VLQGQELRGSERRRVHHGERQGAQDTNQQCSSHGSSACRPASSTPTLRATVAIAPDSAQQADRVDQLMLQGSFGHAGWGGGARVWLPALPRSGTALNTHKNAFIVLVENVLGAALITDDLIRRGNHTSVQALDISSWAKAWNENAKPFIWTKPPSRSWSHFDDF
jgi:hypothetical protein